MTAEALTYSAALTLALDRSAEPAERLAANRLMHELADEMRSGSERPKFEAQKRALSSLVSEAIAQRATGTVIV